MIHADLPLIDLHRHLDGNVRLETILDLAQQHHLPLPADTLEALRPYIQVTEPQSDIMVYFKKFEWMVSVFADYDACRRVAYENVLDAANEGIDYIELRFSPIFMAEPHGLDPQGVVEAVVAGVKEGLADIKAIRVNLIGIISRTYGIQMGLKELDALLAHKADIVGLDLAGDEAGFPAAWFLEHFQKARDAGWGITVHAGESAGPESVWHAIQDLGATRIGHAVRIPEDSALVDFMRENQIGIETSLTSNVHTNTVSSYAHHPLKAFLDSITTNLTRFFRNTGHFESFENHVIPELIQFKQQRGDKRIKVWSAGCSTGEEPYSLAMVLKDKLPADFQLEIIASDLSLKSLMTAKEGYYPEARMAGVPEAYVNRFFQPASGGYRITDDLKKHIRFDYHNLKFDSGQANLDVVFCRNVLIYFDEAAQKNVIDLFWKAMSPHSYLYIGHSESLFGMKTQFQFLKTDWAVLYTKMVG